VHIASATIIVPVLENLFKYLIIKLNFKKYKGLVNEEEIGIDNEDVQITFYN
jgi:hypothetical protein